MASILDRCWLHPLEGRADEAGQVQSQEDAGQEPADELEFVPAELAGDARERNRSARRRLDPRRAGCPKSEEERDGTGG